MRRRVRRTQDPRIAATATIACDSGGPRVARLDSIPATDVLEAVLSVLPLERKGPQGCSPMIAKGPPQGPPQSDLREPDARSKSIGMSKPFTIFLGTSEPGSDGGCAHSAGGLGVNLDRDRGH